MEALRLGGVISTREYEQVLGAYHFFRRLVNALRMLRGSAADLLLPPAEALELKHLARRMGYRLLDAADASPPAERLLRDCDRHAEAVRRFVEHHFARPLPT
jgi:glutamate-ammonia-ligase adenylyltransferase